MIPKKGIALLISHRRGLKTFTSIPGPVSLPLVGTLYKYFPVIGKYKFDELHHNGFKKFKEFGPVVKEEIVPGVNIVWLFDPNDIEIMFRCEGKYPQRRSHLALQKFRLDRPNVYNTGGLLPTNGPDWYKIRKIFQKGLSGPVAVKRFLLGSDDIISEWLERLESIRKQPNLDYLPELSRLFLELTGYATLDLRLHSFSKEGLHKNSRPSKLIKAALATNSCILKLDNGPQLWKLFDTLMYRKLKKSQLFMEDVAIDLLSLKMSFFSERDNYKSLTLLEQYLSCPDLEFKDVIGMVCDFLLAGIDTTTYTTSFLFYHLGKAPSIQMALYEEASRLLPNKNSPVTEEVLNEALYAKAVLKELFRLRPISVGIGRVLNEGAIFSGYEVPQDTVVVSQNQISCRLEKYFSNAHEFKPERWLKSHPLYEKKHPFLLLPFGHGPRSCIARHLSEQNILVMLLKVVRRYKIEWNGSALDSKSLLINKPNGPILLKFYPRLLQLPVEHKQTPKYKPLSDEVLQVLRTDLKTVELFIIDEVSMISNVTLAYINLRLCEVFDTSDVEDGWFGKKHILVLGDLLQLPPVREKSPFEKLTPSEINKLIDSLSIPNLWTELFSYDELTLNMRQLDDSTFVEMLKRIRVGVTTQSDRDILSNRLIPLLSHSNEGRLMEIAQCLRDLPENTVCLLPTRNMCMQLNNAMLKAIPHPKIKLVAKDSLDCSKCMITKARACLQKYEDDASMTAGLEETIIIKEGAKVMLRRNINVSLGLVNGSIGVVQKVRWDPEDQIKPIVQ